MPLIVTTNNAAYKITAQGNRFIGEKTYARSQAPEPYYEIGQIFHFTHLVLYLGECATFGAYRTGKVVSIEELHPDATPLLGSDPVPVCSITPGLENRGFCQ